MAHSAYRIKLPINGISTWAHGVCSGWQDEPMDEFIFAISHRLVGPLASRGYRLHIK